jgi:hypothetical protein
MIKRNYKKKELLIRCVLCGEDFISYRRHSPSPSQINGVAKFCKKCRGDKAKAVWVLRPKRLDKKYSDKAGYIHIRLPNGLYGVEHRVVMEQKLGRKLIKGEVVHHIDGNPGNNKPSNLELWLGPHLTGIKASDVKCPHCGKPYGDDTNTICQLPLLKHRVR